MKRILIALLCISTNIHSQKEYFGYKGDVQALASGFAPAASKSAWHGFCKNDQECMPGQKCMNGICVQSTPEQTMVRQVATASVASGYVH